MYGEKTFSSAAAATRSTGSRFGVLPISPASSCFPTAGAKDCVGLICCAILGAAICVPALSATAPGETPPAAPIPAPIPAAPFLPNSTKGLIAFLVISAVPIPTAALAPPRAMPSSAAPKTPFCATFFATLEIVSVKSSHKEGTTSPPIHY